VIEMIRRINQRLEAVTSEGQTTILDEVLVFLLILFYFKAY